MTRSHLAAVLAALLCLGGAGVCLADDDEAGQAANKGGKQAGKTAAELPVYVPRGRGAPQARIGGATRGLGMGDSPRIEALVPEEVGLTLERQPVLYWYLPVDTKRSIELTLRAPGVKEPVLKTEVGGPLRAGVQRVALADHGVNLEPDMPYFWFVSVVTTEEDTAHGRMSGGGIERVETPKDLATQLAGAKPENRMGVLAGGGIWYDALDAVSRNIEASPGDTTLRAQRSALFEQVGLLEAAGADREGSGG